MADETKITGTGETPAPESRDPESPGPPTAEQGVIPGVTNPPAPSDKVINLSDVLEGAGGGDEAAVTDKKGPPTPEVTDPPAGPTQRGKSLEDDDRQAVSYTHLDVYKRQGLHPDDRPDGHPGRPDAGHLGPGHCRL